MQSTIFLRKRVVSFLDVMDFSILFKIAQAVFPCTNLSRNLISSRASLSIIFSDVSNSALLSSSQWTNPFGHAENQIIQCLPAQKESREITPCLCNCARQDPSVTSQAV